MSERVQSKQVQTLNLTYFISLNPEKQTKQS